MTEAATTTVEDTPVSNDSAQLPDTVEVNNLDEFVRHLVSWHANRMAAIRQLLTVPEGSAFEVGTEEVVMTGDTLKGFKLGLEMALMQVGELPFVAVVEDAEDAVEQPAG